MSSVDRNRLFAEWLRRVELEHMPAAIRMHLQRAYDAGWAARPSLRCEMCKSED